MGSHPRILIVINNEAAKARRVWPGIASSLKDNQIEFDTHITTSAGDATITTREALRSGYEIIAVVGGDGTLSEAAAGFFALDQNVSTGDVPTSINRNAVLAILPAGTGDDFARGLKGTRAPVEKWIADLLTYFRDPMESNTRMVDVIYGSTGGGSNAFISINVVTIGIGAEVARRVARQSTLTQRLPGEVRFVTAAFGALVNWREREVLIRVDGKEEIECHTNLLAVANGIYAGGGMMFAPAACIDDGQLDLLVSRDISRAGILRELPRIRRGGHLANPNVSAIRATCVEIETTGLENELSIEADGNVRGVTPARFQIMPEALRLIL
jgi:YegS/Rv2252/BmrU family lipid kinase